MKKSCHIFSFVFLVLMLISASCFSAFSAENHYYIKELNMGIDLPDNMSAITRESPETDRFFSLFGLDYSTTMSNFKDNNIYLQGMYEDSSKVFTVTMLSDENSKSVDNYTDLSDEQLLDVKNSFLAEREYTSCTIQKYNNYVFMQLQLKTQTDGQTVYATQCNTVIDGKNITLTLQPAKGSELTNEDYQIMDNILKSIEFDGHGMFEPYNLLTNPIVWIILLIVILIIVFVILKIKKKKDKKKIKNQEKKNQEILNELAKEFVSNTVVTQNNLSQNIPETVKSVKSTDYEGEDSVEDIIVQFRNSKDFEEISRKRNNIFKEESDTENQKIDINNINDNFNIVIENNINNPVTEKEKKKENYNIPSKVEDKTVLKVVTPEDEMNDETKEQIKQSSKDGEKSKAEIKETETLTDNYIEDEFIQEYEEYEGYEEEQEDEYEDEYEDEEYTEENSVIGSEESFDQSEDYFDEALNNDIYSRETVDDEDNYERHHISKVDKEAVKEKAKTAGAVVLNGILIFLNGVKSFFIHLGYFCTNLFRLIKRNIKMRKHRKEEILKRRQQEEAKRRREENLRRKQQNISKDANGLLKVHSKSEYPVKNNKNK